MSLFPADEVTFFRLVEQTFLLLTGRGLMLSATDTARVRAWEATGVPARVVCEAVERAFAVHAAERGPRARPLRSLAYCAPAVAEAIDGWRERAVGDGHDV